MRYLIPAAALSSDLLAAFESGSVHDATADQLAALDVASLNGAAGWLVDEDGATHYRPAMKGRPAAKPCTVTRTTDNGVTCYTARAGAKGKGQILSRWRTTGNGDHGAFVAENYRALRTMGYAPIDA